VPSTMEELIRDLGHEPDAEFTERLAAARRDAAAAHSDSVVANSKYAAAWMDFDVALAKYTEFMKKRLGRQA